MADKPTGSAPGDLSGISDEGWDKARAFCEEASRNTTFEPKKGYISPEEIKKNIQSTHPKIFQGTPGHTGYYWMMDLGLDDPKPTMVFVNDGKTWMFGGERIKKPVADKLWFQGGIVPPYPTRDYVRDGRYFTQALSGEFGRWKELPQGVEHS